MYPFIVCFCGRSLGDLRDAFLYLRAKAIEELELGGPDAKLFDPHSCEYDAVVAADQAIIETIFEQLGLHMICCRTHMATQVEFKEYY